MIVPVTLAVIRGILRLYPSRFCDRFGPDVIASVRNDLGRARDGGFASTLICAASAIGDALAGVVPEHRAGRPGIAVWRGFRTDLRDAIRSLRHAGAVTTVAVATLALGIASATTVFSIVDAVVLRGLPFDHHDRIVAVLEDNPKRNVSGATMPQIYLDWRERQQSFAYLAATNRQQYRLRNDSGEGRPGDAEPDVQHQQHGRREVHRIDEHLQCQCDACARKPDQPAKQDRIGKYERRRPDSNLEIELRRVRDFGARAHESKNGVPERDLQRDQGEPDARCKQQRTD